MEGVVRCRPLCALATIILLLLVLIAIPPCASTTDSKRYVRLDYSVPVDSLQHCGANENSPCPNIQAAIASWKLQVGASSSLQQGMQIVLLAGSSVVQRQSLLSPSAMERIEDVHNMSITTAQPGMMISMNLELNQTWLLLERCQDIAISGLHISWVNMSLGTAVKLKHSRAVRLSNVMFIGIRRDSHAVQIVDSWPVWIGEAHFEGLDVPLHAPSQRAENYTLSAIEVSYTCLQPCASECNNQSSSVNESSQCDPSQQTASLFVEYSSFYKLGFQRTAANLQSSSQRTNSILQATAVSIEIAPHVTKKTVIIAGSNFTALSSPFDPVARLVFGSQSIENSIRFDGCHFHDNAASFGSAFYIDFGPDTNNSVFLVGGGRYGTCSFSNNIAYAESAVGRVSFYERSFLFRQLSQLIIDGCTFSRNFAGAFLPLCGGCFTVTSNTQQHSGGRNTFGQMSPSLYRVQVSNSHFERNSAALGAVFYLQKTSARFQNCTFSGNDGTALFVESSIISLANSTTFQGNGGTSAGTGGAISLRKNSLLRVEEGSTTSFVRNVVSTGQGGAVYVDQQTSTSTLLQVVERTTEVNISFKPCFFQVPLGTNVSFLNTNQYGLSSSATNTSTIVSFSDNNAQLGRDIYATAFLPCYGSPLYPAIRENRPEASLPPPLTRTAAGPSLSTGPAWLLFLHSSCSCLKQLNQSTFWLYRVCNSSRVTEDYQSHSFAEGDGLANALNSTLDFITAWTEDVHIPPLQYFLAPWGTLLWRYNYLSSLNLSLAQKAGNITLYPAPGEEFTLSVKALDSRLHGSQSSLLLQVTRGDVLLRYGGLQFHQQDYISFPSQHQLLNVALAGKPGTSGLLTIQTQGIVSQHNFYVEIPFRLRPCHVGWKSTLAMSKSTVEVQNMINKVTATVSTASNQSLNQLICACQDPVNTECSGDGHNVTVKASRWAGYAHVQNTTLFSHTDRSTIYNLTKHEHQVVLEADDFQVHSCVGAGIFCSASVDTDWRLESTDPCNPGERRTGLLCGSCQNGYSLVALGGIKCHNCQGKNIAAGVALFFFVTLIYTLALVALSVLLGVGSGATFETWSFSIQISQFLSPTLRKALNGFNGGYYGANQCISENLGASASLATSFIVPLHLLLSLVVVYTLFRKVRWVRLRMISHSLFPTLWAAIIWSYNYIVYISGPMLTCPLVNGERVFLLQPLVECFSGSHLPFAVLALLLALATAIPVPLVLVLARKTSLLKPFSNVYLAPLKEDMSWWIAWTMFRRFGLVIFSNSLSGTVRIVTLLVVLELYLLLQFFVMPYKQPLDNYFEIFCLSLLAFQALLALVPSPVTTLVVYIIPFVVAFGIGLYRSRYTVLQVINRLGLFCQGAKKRWYGETAYATKPCVSGGMSNLLIQAGSEAARPRSASHYSFRDPLLFDTLGDIPE